MKLGTLLLNVIGCVLLISQQCCCCSIILSTGSQFTEANLTAASNCTNITLGNNGNDLVTNVTIDIDGTRTPATAAAAAVIGGVMTITSNQNAVRNVTVRLSNLQGNARLISGFSFQHTGTSIADVSVIISNASLDMSSSAVFFQMFFGNASNIVFQLHQVNVTGTLPLVSAFPSYSGIVSLQGPSVSNLNVVFSECSINLSAAPNFGLIWTNTTHILLAAQLRIISMVIQWEIDCRGARNERCGRQATATTFSDMISLSNINGALDAVTIVMDTLRFSVGQLTDVFSQSGFASSLIRICGTTTATAGRMSNSSVVVKSVTMVGHTTEMDSLIILAYFNGGVNDTNFSVVDVSADIKVAGDRPRLRGRIDRKSVV